MSNVVAEQGPRAVAQTTPSDLLRIAVEQGADLDKLEKLFELQTRWDAVQAKKAFDQAVAAFKANPPAVTKDKDNLQYGSRYTTIGNLVNTVNRAMSPHGLSARWDIEQSDKIKVTCILSHQLGHSERVSLHGLPDDSGKKNPLQQIKSTVTYLKIATFEAVTGVASEDGNADDDGNGSNDDDGSLAVASDLIDKIKKCETSPALAEIKGQIKDAKLPHAVNVSVIEAYNAKFRALKPVDAKAPTYPDLAARAHAAKTDDEKAQVLSDSAHLSKIQKDEITTAMGIKK